MNFALKLAMIGLAATAVPAAAAITDVVQAPTGFFVPTDAQKYDFPYYRGFGQDWEWMHGPVAGPITTASLNISAFDVDFASGERDAIDVMDDGVWTFVGFLTGTDDQWEFGNSFDLGSEFHNDINSGLNVRIRIDTTNAGWIVTLGKSALSIDGGVLPPPQPGIPEASTWAMLIAGFGLVGFTARRRRTALSAA